MAVLRSRRSGNDVRRVRWSGGRHGIRASRDVSAVESDRDGGEQSAHPHERRHQNQILLPTAHLADPLEIRLDAIRYKCWVHAWGRSTLRARAGAREGRVERAFLRSSCGAERETRQNLLEPKTGDARYRRWPVSILEPPGRARCCRSRAMQASLSLASQPSS